MIVIALCCVFLLLHFAVHVGAGVKKGKGWKDDSPVMPSKKANNTSKKQKTFHDSSSSDVVSALPAISRQAPNSPGDDWIESDIDFGRVFYGF